MSKNILDLVKGSSFYTEQKNSFLFKELKKMLRRLGVSYKDDCCNDSFIGNAGVDRDEQTLSTTGNEISISNGNSIDICPIVKNCETKTKLILNPDNSLTYIDEEGNSNTILISFPDSDNQTLIVNNDNTLTINGGNTIDLCPIIKNCETKIQIVNNNDGTYTITNENGDNFVISTLVNTNDPLSGNGSPSDPITLNYNNDLGSFGGVLQQGFPLVRNTTTDLSGFNRMWNGSGRIGIANAIGIVPSVSTKVQINNTLTQPLNNQYALSLINNQTNTASQANDKSDLFISTITDNGGFVNSGRQCAIQIASIYNGTGIYTNIRNFQNAVALNAPISGGNHILNHNTIAINSGAISGGTIIGVNAMANSQLGANINNLIYYNAEFSPVWDGFINNMYGYRMLNLPLSGFTKGYAFHSSDSRARVVIMGIPLYVNTSTASSDSNLDIGQFFRVSNGDGTSQLHIKL